jgi:prophage antirepressor-like protein
MNEIKIFNNQQFGEIRTATNETGEPLFCLADLCSALDLTPKGVNQRLSDEVISNYPIVDNLGRTQQALFVNEEGLYDVILDSRKPEAKAFRKWVTSEVLPTIRKHGAYMTQSTIEKTLTDPDFIIQLAQNLKEERRLKEMAQKQLQYQAPILSYANEVLSSKTGHTSTTIAGELNMSAITLNKLLVKAHFIRKTGKHGEYSICAAHQGKGLTVTDTYKYSHADAETGQIKTGTKIEIKFTEAGRMKIHEIFKRAIAANVLVEKKGRYFINDSWKESEKAA